MTTQPCPERYGEGPSDQVTQVESSASGEVDVNGDEAFWDARPRRKSWATVMLHSAALMATMRATEAYLWPNPFAETRLSVVGQHYKAAFTQPPKWDSSLPWFEWDGDRWQINVIGHGLFGSELYARARFCGHSVIESFVFTTAASAVWEYGVEGSGVRPSGLDLWFTPVSGAAIGELRYWAWYAVEDWSPMFRWPIRILTDPLGQFERGFGAPC